MWVPSPFWSANWYHLDLGPWYRIKSRASCTSWKCQQKKWVQLTSWNAARSNAHKWGRGSIVLAETPERLLLSTTFDRQSTRIGPTPAKAWARPRVRCSVCLDWEGDLCIPGSKLWQPQCQIRWMQVWVERHYRQWRRSTRVCCERDRPCLRSG